MQNEEIWHRIDAYEPVDYKLISHFDCEFNESAVMKQKDGKYTLLKLGNLQMGGSWEGFCFLETMKDFDRVLLAVVPPDLGFSQESEFVQSCVIVKRNGLWGCISTRCQDYSRVIIPIRFKSEEDVKRELKKASMFDVDFIWKTYEEYSGADEFTRN